MGPTGSIFGRSSRTRSASARLLALVTVAGVVLLATARAHADWRTDLYLMERPNDVLDMWGERSFSVGYTSPSDSGAYLFLDGVLSRKLVVGSSSDPAGTYYDVTDDCLVSVLRDGHGSRRVLGPGGATNCARNIPSDSPATLTDASLWRVKHTVGGGVVAMERLSDPLVFLSNTQNIYSAQLALTDQVPVTFTGTFGVARVNGTVYAVAAEASLDSAVDWLWDVGSGLVRERIIQDTTPMGIVQAIDVFPAGSPAWPYAVVGTSQGFLQGSLRLSPNPLHKVQELGDGLGVTSLSINVENTATLGTGFGMALVARPDGSGLKVMSPVPMLSPMEAGTVWLDRTLPLPPEMAGAPLKEVACWGSRSCVFTADRAGPGNLFIYTNAASPKSSVVAAAGSGVVASGGEVEIDEQTSFSLSLTALDPDGDPVRMTATATSSAPWSPTVLAATPGAPIPVTGTTGKVCPARQPVGSFEIDATDGLAAHEVHETFQVYVKHTVPPAKPSVRFSDGSVLADGVPVNLRAGLEKLTLSTSVAGSDCTLVVNEWRPSTPEAAKLLVQGVDAGTNVAVFTPPPSLCEAGGADFDYRYQVTDEGGLSSTHDLKVHVLPWGPPKAVFSPDAGDEHLYAGGPPLTLSRGSSPHDCTVSPSFPGVVTDWQVTLDDGRDPGSAIKRTTAPDTSELVLEAQHCLPSSVLHVSAVNRLASPDATSSPSSMRKVQVHSDRELVGSADIVLAHDRLPSDELRVSVDSPLNCKAERGLHAELELTPKSGDGAPVKTTVQVPGEGQLPLGLGCQGGSFYLSASLVEDTGQRSDTATTISADVDPLKARLQSVPSEPVLVARCGEGARMTLSLTFPKDPDTCPSPAISWSQKEGPPLEQTTLSGNTLSLATRDTGLDALVGRSVEVRVLATVSEGNEASVVHSLPITVEPFVKVRRRTEVPAAAETGLVGISVELLNTTACGVSGVSFVEHLEGLTYVAGSAKFDGQPVEATWEEGSLTVSGLALKGEGTGTLTYVARPHLVGDRRMDGEARLREVPISLSENPGVQVPESGCGCTSSGPGPVVFALGVLGAAVRRRRRA